jgi:Holliday junction DNA helicase RuvA
VIAYLRGPILRRSEEVVVVEAGGVGYEVHLPGVVARALPVSHDGTPQTVELYISYHVSQNQPRPLLVGFLHEIEQEFFERFITVDGMGPTKAMKAIVHPIHVIADAVERKDSQFLRRLPGIGERTAEKIIAALHGKMGKYALLKGEEMRVAPAEEDFKAEVLEVLTAQLGHRSSEARRMVDEAMRRQPGISSAEELFQEVYRVEKEGGSTFDPQPYGRVRGSADAAGVADRTTRG